MRVLRRRARPLAIALAFLFATALAGCAGREARPVTARQAVAPPSAAPLPAVSGLACLPDGSLLAVHDTKNPRPGPRVSRLRLADEGLVWESLDLDWPAPDGLSSDLESAAAVPGTSSLLLVESGPFQGKFGRVFHVAWEGGRLALRGTATLPQPVENVEGTAVVRSGERLLLLWAERGEGADSTSLRWAELALDPLRLGEAGTATVAVPEPRDPARRQVTALEADGEGRLWAASTSDPGDRGPFRSFVWEIGKVGAAGVEVEPTARQVAVVDGFKIEALAVCDPEGKGRSLLFLGTDDEALGGTVRPLPDR